MRLEAERRADEVGQGKPISSHAGVYGVDIANEEKNSKSGPFAQQQELIDESKEMLEYFRKEVFKVKSANYLLRVDLGSLKLDYQHLQMRNESLEASNGSLKQSMNRMSQMNMKMNIQAAEQKNKISGLVQELKMEQLCGQSTLKRKEEAILGRDKMHSAETARLKRELENLQKIISKGPGSPFEEKPKIESASFRRGTRLNRKNGLGNRLSVGVQHSSISRSTSTENISISGSTQASSEEEWPNSIVNSARTDTRQRQSNIQRGRRPKLRKGRPPPISTTLGTVADPGSRNSLARFQIGRAHV